MKAMTDEHLAILRRHMVEVIDIHFDLAATEIGQARLGDPVRAAMLAVPRHMFVPPQFAIACYADTPLPIGFDKTVSQPFIGGLMLDLLDLAPSQRVLEIGTGLGYQAAVMAAMGAEVFSVEIVEEFAQAARVRLGEQGHDVDIRVGDGSRGWSDHAPFDRILITAATGAPPRALIEQLAPGGQIVLPMEVDDAQILSVVTLHGPGEYDVRPVLPVRFTKLETMG